ncbi:hypothetical protein TNIN_202011 [Trichonephila inaurata madagascariensis]|uniref:Uncharacterized protein n=1 Tax=Trichonephila inaurata madagascariensis TaxID=2747483 RepID=A0A8X6YHW0_9ARAC|nr:hypothetical protein TNIN_202011 [Trichonephila inaurata madagascariensis]
MLSSRDTQLQRPLSRGLLWTAYECKDYLHFIFLYQLHVWSSRLRSIDDGTRGLELVSDEVNRKTMSNEILSPISYTRSLHFRTFSRS